MGGPAHRAHRTAEKKEAESGHDCSCNQSSAATGIKLASGAKVVATLTDARQRSGDHGAIRHQMQFCAGFPGPSRRAAGAARGGTAPVSARPCCRPGQVGRRAVHHRRVALCPKIAGGGRGRAAASRSREQRCGAVTDVPRLAPIAAFGAARLRWLPGLGPATDQQCQRLATDVVARGRCSPRSSRIRPCREIEGSPRLVRRDVPVVVVPPVAWCLIAGRGIIRQRALRSICSLAVLVAAALGGLVDFTPLSGARAGRPRSRARSFFGQVHARRQ